VNSLDRKLASALKADLKQSKAGSGEKLSNEFHKILGQVVNEDLRRTLETLFSKVACQTNETIQPEVTESLRQLRTLLEHGFRETPSIAFLVWLDSFSRLTVDEVLSVAPDTICFGKWLKKAKASAQEIRRQLAENPGQAYATIGADWLLEHPKPEFSWSVVERFLSRQLRPEYLLPWNEALAAAMKKDKRGELLTAILRQPSMNQEQLQALSGVIRLNRVLLKTVADLLPMVLARKDSTAAAVHFVHCLFDDVITSEGSEREFSTAVIGRLGAGILLADRRSPHSDKVLVLARKIARQLRNLTKGETAQANTWVFENLCEEEEPGDGKLCVNLQGARCIALAFEKADQGFAAKDVLRNVVRRNRGGELMPDYGRMFGQQNVYIQAARGFVLHGGHDNLVTVLVVDIGAFTTDIASLTFDVSAMSDGLSAIRQESHALGVINELDKPLFDALGERHDIPLSNLSFRDSENLKRSFYNGTSYFLLTRSGGKDVSVELGNTKDMQTIANVAGKFAEAVWKKLSPLIDEQKPERVFLTGGGSLIRPIATELKAAFNRRRIPVQDVQQDSVAMGAEVWRPWKDTGEGLQRLATALGGANVIPQESASTLYDGENVARRRPPVVAGPPAGYRSCRCQGGNKDCCFCGGRGFCA
jgi:hypothetical protein